MPRCQPQQPHLIDPAGVPASAYPRSLAKTTDASRAYTAKATGGEPSVDFAGTSNPYVDCQSIDLLLSLLHPRSQGYDEMCFFVMGQVKELLFRALHSELYNAQLQTRADAVANALEILRRAKAIGEYITRSWDVLSTISPEGFNQFRNSLGAASGQLSFMYRHVEFVLGNKDRRLASAFKNMPHVWPGIEAALNSRSLYDDVIALLARRGLAVDKDALGRDWSLATRSTRRSSRPGCRCMPSRSKTAACTVWVKLWWDWPTNSRNTAGGILFRCSVCWGSSAAPAAPTAWVG